MLQIQRRLWVGNKMEDTVRQIDPWTLHLFRGYTKSGVNALFFERAGCSEGVDWGGESGEGGEEASLGLTGNLNGVETGLDAIRQIHLNPTAAISYREFRGREACLSK